jgi:hypothetical protein
MKHDPQSFGKSDRAGWYLRAQIKRRREARNAAIVCAGAAVTAATGAGISDGQFHNVGGAVVLGLIAALFLLVGTFAASEA